MSDSVAILGAGGFVGARLVEMGIAAGRSDLVPVVRSCRSLARLSKFGVQPRWGDVSRTEELRPAIRGCSVVVNLTVGDYFRLEANTRNIYEACAAEQARLLIHVSSAEVFGRVENSELNEDSEPDSRHWMAYARGKARAELALRPRMRNAPFAIVVLRPGLVWGPASPWTVEPAADLLNQQAFLADGGTGICNLIYIDNLIGAIRRVVHHPKPRSGFYNVADRETITWGDYYGELARRLNVPLDRVPRLGAGDYVPKLGERLQEWRQTKVIRHIEGAIPGPSMRRLKKQLRQAWRLIHANSVPASPRPRVTRSLWHLQHTRHKLPTAKFDEVFGKAQEFTFMQAMDKTCAWLRFAGFASSAPAGGQP
jgi:nucleoside-diphosphate-sugar epimerase